MLLLPRDRHRRTWWCGRVGTRLRSSNGFEQALRRTLRKPPDPIRDRSLRRESRSHLFDLALGPARRPREEGPHVLVREMRDEHTQAGEMNGARAKRVENRRPAPTSPGHAEPVVSGAVRESELLHAKDVHRRIGALRIELPLVYLGEMEQELRLHLARAADELPRAREKVIVIHDGNCEIGFDHTEKRSTSIWRALYKGRPHVLDSIPPRGGLHCAAALSASLFAWNGHCRQ